MPSPPLLKSSGLAPPSVPQDFQALQTMLVERRAHLPKRLGQVAHYALQHPDEIAFGTAASIASAAHVQPSTLVRFAQTLGFQGFSQLQEIFRNRLRERVLNYDERMAQLRAHQHDSHNSHQQALPNAGHILVGFTSAASQSLQRLNERTNPANLERAISVLEKADTVYILGLRRSYAIASYLHYGLTKLRIRNILFETSGGLAQDQVAMATPNDALLAISFTPYAAETLALVKAATERQVPLLAVTDSDLSPLVPQAQAWLEVAEGNFEGFRSMASSMVLAMTLAVALAERRSRNAHPEISAISPHQKLPTP